MTLGVNSFRPELLCPAGSLEKLKVAVLYGADAVYLGGQDFGLRSAADNFTDTELEEGVDFAHSRGAKVFVVLNSFLHDQDLENLTFFIKKLEALKVDAVIVSDLGVVTKVREETSLVVHLSTQASCLNSFSAQLWKKMGVSRVVLGREVSIREAQQIKQISGLEVEMFVHGAMCMAYSGNCVISNYTQGRDSNRGGCAHSCRFEYELQFQNQQEKSEILKKNAYFMSSKDLSGIRVLKDFIDCEIDSLKVEGRMKSHHYAGSVAKTYAEALNFYEENGHFLSQQIYEWEEELKKVSHRDYTEASLVLPADESSIHHDRESLDQDYQVVGIIREQQLGDYLLVEVRSAFYPEDDLEIVPFCGKPLKIKPQTLYSSFGQEISKTRPGSLVKIPFCEGAETWNLIRRKASNDSLVMS